MNETISLSEGLTIINRKDREGKAFPFDISVRTLNKNSRTGGKLNIYTGAKLLDQQNKPGGSDGYLLENVLVQEKSEKQPNHWKNRTRNIILPNGEIKKIHVRLIIEINNHKVVF